MSTGRVIFRTGEDISSQVEDYSFQSLQLEDLKKAMARKEEEKKGRQEGKRSIAVISGKGGVGKSSFALNLALLMGERYHKPAALIDADLGLANADVLLGLDTRLNLNHVIRGELSLREITLPVSERVWLVPGGSGIPELAEMDPEARARLLPQIMALDDMVDVIVIDTGAGINSTVREFSMAADAIVIITTPEPTALKDAYGMVKTLFHCYSREELAKKEIHVVINMAFSRQEAIQGAERIIHTSKHFLDLDLNFLGYLPYDLRVPKAVKSRCPLVKLYPRSNLARRMEDISGKLLLPLAESGQPSETSTPKGAMARLLNTMIQRIRPGK